MLPVLLLMLSMCCFGLAALTWFGAPDTLGQITYAEAELAESRQRSVLWCGRLILAGAIILALAIRLFVAPSRRNES